MLFTGFSLKNSVQSLKRLPARVRRNLSEYRFYAYLAVLGPGIIAANAGNDASGIATYSTVGAGYGYSLLWIFIPITLSLIVVQEMCVRMGVVTGQGLADLIREQFGVRLTALVMLALLIANTGVIVSEFIGIAQASELFGIPRYFTIPVTSGLIWWLVVKGSQKRVERVFLLMSLVFFGYIFSAFMAQPDWELVGKEFVNPSFSIETGYLIYCYCHHRNDDHAVYAGFCAIVGSRKTDGRRRFAARSRRCRSWHFVRLSDRRFYRYFDRRNASHAGH